VCTGASHSFVASGLPAIEQEVGGDGAAGFLSDGVSGRELAATAAVDADAELHFVFADHEERPARRTHRAGGGGPAVGSEPVFALIMFSTGKRQAVDHEGGGIA
jgi:hypothetical protein